MESLRPRTQTNRAFGKSITNNALAGAQKENVDLKGIKKRGSNENVVSGTKKPKLVEDRENVPIRGKDVKKKVEKEEPKQVEPKSVVSIAGQCLQTTVNQVESHVRSLDISEGDTVPRPTRPAGAKQGILGQIISAAITTVTSVTSVQPSVPEVVAGPCKPKRAVPTKVTPFKELLKNRSAIDFSDPETYYEPPVGLPDDIADFDKTQVNEVASEPFYADSVFKYYRQMETKNILPDYMANQKYITKAMRSVLVDWMVEVQESFELNHETLYLGVKLVDHYLSKEIIAKEKFQLLGATCLFIAAKFDERIPPSIEDFLYICDDAYLRRDLISFEMEVFKKLEFFVGFAISYRFLRRYARVAKLTMEQLTLARYILEMSLMDYDVTCFEKDSKVAAAALLLALRMKQMSWTVNLEFYSGYEESDLIPLMNKLNDLISCPIKTNKTVRQKYSHKIFFEVAKIPPLPRS